MNKFRVTHTYCYFSLLFLLLISCYSRKEACLENLAENYDVLADDACVGCCVFPKLVLNFIHMAGDSLFRTDSTLTNSKLQKFSILEIKYYLSDFDLYNQNGQKFDVLENIYTSDKSYIIPDDIKVARNSVQELSIGSIKGAGQFDSLTFYLGLNPMVLESSFIDLSSTHVLLNANKIKDSTNLTALLSLRLKRNLAITDTLNLFVNADALLLKLKIDSTIITHPGSKPIYSIRADYLKLFENTDLSLSKVEVQNQIKQNIHKFLIVK